MLDDKDLQAIAGLINSTIEKNNKALLDQFNTVLESNVIPQIKAVAEGHSIIIERLPNADEQEDLKSRVQVLEQIVKEHSKAIEELKKAQ